jgi:hypothetical protein
VDEEQPATEVVLAAGGKEVAESEHDPPAILRPVATDATQPPRRDPMQASDNHPAALRRRGRKLTNLPFDRLVESFPVMLRSAAFET